MAQDLASAIVDLSVSAETRRQGRRAFRDSVEVIVREILKRVRVGDTVSFELETPQGGFQVYKVERIDWEIEWDGTDTVRAKESEPTLVLYRGNANDWTEDVQGLAPGWRYEGCVLLDVRHNIQDFVDTNTGVLRVESPVVGRNVFRVPQASETDPYSADLHLATDEDLMAFSHDAFEVVQLFTDLIRADGNKFGDAAAKLTKLAPK
jgi:hypothetical protein